MNTYTKRQLAEIKRKGAEWLAKDVLIEEIKLTPHQLTYLRAIYECDSVTNERLRLQTLNRLIDKGLIHCFGVETANNGRYIYHFSILPRGIAFLEATS